MNEYKRLYCSIFDMKEMLENGDLYCRDVFSKAEYRVIGCEKELLGALCSGLYIYQKQTQEQMDEQEIKELEKEIIRLVTGKNNDQKN